MANQIFNSPHVAGTFDRQILVANQSQAVAVANPGRTYWCIQNRTFGAKFDLSLGSARGNGPGSHRLLPGESIDSSVVPELTQTAIFITGNIAGAEFTFEEVAPAQSAQS